MWLQSEGLLDRYVLHSHSLRDRGVGDLADGGVAGAIERDPGLRMGVNVAAGKVTHPAVAEGVAMEYVPVEQALGLQPQLQES